MTLFVLSSIRMGAISTPANIASLMADTLAPDTLWRGCNVSSNDRLAICLFTCVSFHRLYHWTNSDSTIKTTSEPPIYSNANELDMKSTSALMSEPSLTLDSQP